MEFFKKLFRRKKSFKLGEDTIETVKFAVENNIPILVGSQSRIDYLKEISQEVEVYGFAKNFTTHISRREFPNGIIVDSSVKEDMVNLLKTSSNFSHIKIIN